MRKLPRVMSELMRLALADVRKCAANRRYKINMSEWHVPRAGFCHVCMAGAIMSQTLEYPVDKYADTCNFGDNELALDAVNFIRSGWFRTAAVDLRLVVDEEALEEMHRVYSGLCQTIDLSQYPPAALLETWYSAWDQMIACLDELGY